MTAPAPAFEFEVQGNYGDGWECVDTTETRVAALASLQTYRENQPQYPHRYKRVRATES